jgi:aspartate-semialdehyde dehydrogenase
MRFAHLEGLESLAIVGATGLVGTEVLSLLTESKIRIKNVSLLASESSAGETLVYGDQEIRVEALTPRSFEGVEAALFSVPSDITKKFVPMATKAGTLSIVDSSVYRMDPEVALVVPEVNGAVLREYSGKVVSIPNCTTTPLVMVLKPLADNFGLERVVVSTYQSVSGAGEDAYQELAEQTGALLNGQVRESMVFPHRIAFNCLPQIGDVTETGDTEEESKILHESRKILGLPELKVTSTSVRVPTFISHGLSVNVQLKKDFGSVQEVRGLLDNRPGLKVVDNPSHNIYPTSVEATGADQVFVGRVRQDRTVPHGLNLWIVADNLRKGAALNGLQILDTLYKYRRMS